MKNEIKIGQIYKNLYCEGIFKVSEVKQDNYTYDMEIIKNTTNCDVIHMISSSSVAWKLIKDPNNKCEKCKL